MQEKNIFNQEKLTKKISDNLERLGIKELRPVQKKSIESGLLDSKNMLVCTPTASGKTLVGELAFLNTYYKGLGKSIYIVPLKALATEKFSEFKEKYPFLRIALSIGDLDSSEPYLDKYDLIICTSEKLDSLIRHNCPWIKDIALLIIDEIHLLNDPGRGPTLEILIIMLKRLLKDIQIIGLSATIGNPKELANWLGAELVIDTWRPISLYKGICLENEIEFY
jgi:helicase